MKNVNDDFILGLVKGRIGELMERMDRERPELSQEARVVYQRIRAEAGMPSAVILVRALHPIFASVR